MKAHRRVYHSTLGSRVIKKAEEDKRYLAACHPGVELRANLKSIAHRCDLIEVASAWEFTSEAIHLPLGGGGT